MATLPDIDTTNVGGITFYNVKDEQGVSDDNFDPMDFSDWSELKEIQIYDNGIEADVNAAILGEGVGSYQSKDNIVRFRCKNDGWVIMWSPTSENYFGTGKYTDGTTAFLRGAYNFYGICSEKQYWILMESALSHAGYGVTITPSDTVFGHYNYNAPDASNVTVAYGDSPIEWSFTSSVDRKTHYTIMTNGDILSDSDGEIVSNDTASGAYETHSSVDVLNEVSQGWTFDRGVTSGETYKSYTWDVGDNGMASLWS